MMKAMMCSSVHYTNNHYNSVNLIDWFKPITHEFENNL